MHYVFGILAVICGLAVVVLTLACRLFCFALTVSLAVALADWLLGTTMLAEHGHLPWTLLWLSLGSLAGVFVTWLLAMIFGALAVEAA